MSPRPSLVPALLSAVLFAYSLSGCSTPDPAEEEPEAAIPVAVAPVTLGPIAAAYRGTTSIEAPAEATVVAKLSGVIQTLLVEEGQSVQAGTVLARLDDERLRLEAQRARSRHAQLAAEFERNKKVYRQRLISSEIYDRSRFELEGAKAALELAELSLREAQIRAPIDGVISARHVKLGNTVLVNEPLFRITDLGHLEAALHVPERAIHKLSVGQAASLSVDAWPEQGFSGQVRRISPVVDPATGTVKVTLGLDNPQHRLLPGMFGRLQVQYDYRDQAVLIPKDAVLIEDAQASVFVVRDGQAWRKPILLGYSNGLHYEVTSGLEAGQQVVTTGRASLKDGVAVEIVDDEA